jgi:DNA-binding response OmpR family regulator
MTKHILMVHADGLLARSLADQLIGQGFRVDTVAAIGEAERWLAGQATDLVLLDAQAALPAPTASCQTLRSCVADCPIVVLGVGRAAEAALKAAGASACLAKPYRFAGLLQRLQEQLREPAGGSQMPIGPFLLHPLARQLVDATGRRIHLTEKETAILTYLHRAGARVVPRDELLGEVWGYSSAVSTHTVETHIYRLRRKLADESTVEPLLSTAEGGYRLN